jgi:hypothetical protein
MNLHVSPSTIATAEPNGRPDFNAFLDKTLPQLPADAAVLIPLYEAYRAAGAAMMSVFNKPRAGDDASEFIWGDIEKMNDSACAVAVKLSQLTSVSDHWRDSYLETMLSHNFFVGDDSSAALEVIAKFNALRVTETPTSH